MFKIHNDLFEMSDYKSMPAIMDNHDWSLCFICQSDKGFEPIKNPSSSVKLRNKPERLSVCYKEVTDNTQELKELGELPDTIVVDGIGGGTQNVVQMMMSDQAVWHKNCRNSVNNQKVQRVREKNQGKESVSLVKLAA